MDLKYGLAMRKLEKCSDDPSMQHSCNKSLGWLDHSQRLASLLLLHVCGVCVCVHVEATVKLLFPTLVGTESLDELGAHQFGEAG